MMVLGIGLSSYNIALFHLINHAFYKALLFLGAGSVIHAVADNQDLRKYGGLIKYLPLTYSVMLIASLSLVAFPFMTGFYSKDFILESAYGQFSFSGVAAYIIATVGAVFTTLYSVKVLYLTFLANPNGPRAYYRLAVDNLFNSHKSYKPAHEGDFFLTSPLVILALFSIFFGFITKDIFIGMGSNFFVDNSLFIHPTHEIMIDTEFAVPVLFKLLPFIFTISFSIIALTLSEFLSERVISFKLSRLGYNIFGFFNQRFLIEFFYNKYITNLILNLGGQITKVLDKGSIELFGPFGLEKGLVRLSKYISSLSTSHVTTYALYILIGFIGFISHQFSAFNLFVILIIILVLILGNGESSDGYPRERNYHDNKLRKNSIIYNNKRMFSTSTSFLNPGNSAGNGSGSGGSSNPNGNSAGNGSGSVAPNDGQATQEAFDRALEERSRIGEEYVRENDIHSDIQNVPEGQEDLEEQAISEEQLRFITARLQDADDRVAERHAEHVNNRGVSPVNGDDGRD
jgi:NADH-ubiquinone oxidoreductase chain 5